MCVCVCVWLCRIRGVKVCCCGGAMTVCRIRSLVCNLIRLDLLRLCMYCIGACVLVCVCVCWCVSRKGIQKALAWESLIRVKCFSAGPQVLVDRYILARTHALSHTHTHTQAGSLFIIVTRTRQNPPRLSPHYAGLPTLTPLPGHPRPVGHDRPVHIFAR